MTNPAAKFIMKALLKSAMHFEEQSRDFYAEAVSRVSNPESRETLRKLSGEEDRHWHKLHNLAESDHTEELVLGSHVTDLPPVTSDDSSAPTIPAGADLKEILEVALKREIAAETFYTELAHKASFETARKVFEFLAEEEMHHVEWVKKILAEGKN